MLEPLVPVLYAPLAYADRLQLRALGDIDLVVIHCTELPDLAMAREYGERIVHASSQTGNSGHYYIDRDGAVQQWVLGHLAEPLNLAQMAAQAAMSERHFRRVFQQETGQSPSAFVEAARLEGAKQLLQSHCGLPLKTVAARVGLASEQALRHLFVRRMGITPLVYRERFGGQGRRERP